MLVVNPHSEQWVRLAPVAWATRENAFAIRTKVGAALLAEHRSGEKVIYGGCNIEDLWKASSIHAERSAISNMVSAGGMRMSHILVAAARRKFTPCGNCLDFIFQFGGPACEIGFQGEQGGMIDVYTANELMPHYPS